MDAAEKMELYLKQELSLQLHKPIESIPADQNYFDLGLTSLAIAHLIGKMNRLLGEELQPSALFDYTDIQSLAAYLALPEKRQLHRERLPLLGLKQAKSPRPDSSRGPRQHASV